MLAMIPTYEVIVDPDDEKLRRVFRVPKTNLNAFLHVLTFNAVEDFRVILEPNPLAEVRAGRSRKSREPLG